MADRTMPDASPLRTGDPAQLGAYELLGRLGEGGQGAVFLARLAERAGRGDGDREYVAIKLLHAGLTANEAARARFVRELEVAKRVARFCTAQIVDADVAGDQPYIVSEFVEGRSLHRLVKLEGPRSGGSLERLAISTLTALTAIHQAGIVHRDFKPQNVLLGPDGPRVIDFGVARALGAAGETQNVGTPAYMAPEQFDGKGLGPAADLFAWGTTMAFAATGRPAFGNDEIGVVMHRIVNAEPDLGAIPSPLRDVVADCLAKDPTQRPTARQAQERLVGGSTEAARGGPAAAPPIPNDGGPAAAQQAPPQPGAAVATPDGVSPAHPHDQASGAHGQAPPAPGQAAHGRPLGPHDQAPGGHGQAPAAAAHGQPPPGAYDQAPGGYENAAAGDQIPGAHGPTPPGAYDQAGAPGGQPPSAYGPAAGEAYPAAGAHDHAGAPGGQAPGGQAPGGQAPGPYRSAASEAYPAAGAYDQAGAPGGQAPGAYGAAAGEAYGHGPAAGAYDGGPGQGTPPGAHTPQTPMAPPPAAYSPAPPGTSPPGTPPTGTSPPGTPPPGTPPFGTHPGGTHPGGVTGGAGSGWRRGRLIPVAAAAAVGALLVGGSVWAATTLGGGKSDSRNEAAPGDPGAAQGGGGPGQAGEPGAGGSTGDGTGTRSPKTRPGGPTPAATRSDQARRPGERGDATARPGGGGAGGGGGGGGGSERPNPYNPQQVCNSGGHGGGYYVQRSKAFSHGTVYQLYNSSGYNCAVTMKTVNVGKRTKVWTRIQRKNDGKSGSDSGSFQYYAGPAFISAKSQCVRFSGGAGGSSVTSSWDNCG